MASPKMIHAPIDVFTCPIGTTVTDARAKLSGDKRPILLLASTLVNYWFYSVGCLCLLFGLGCERQGSAAAHTGAKSSAEALQVLESAPETHRQGRQSARRPEDLDCKPGFAPFFVTCLPEIQCEHEGEYICARSGSDKSKAPCPVGFICEDDNSSQTSPSSSSSANSASRANHNGPTTCPPGFICEE